MFYVGYLFGEVPGTGLMARFTCEEECKVTSDWVCGCERRTVLTYRYFLLPNREKCSEGGKIEERRIFRMFARRLRYHDALTAFTTT